MKKSKKILIAIICILATVLININVSKAYNFSSKHIILNNDFTSKHITATNDEKATQEKLYPVIHLKNNTNRDIIVTYSFYIKSTDTSEFDADILVKANDTAILELPQLHHLGNSKESRTIWLSWSEPRIMKPLQNQIETSIFSNFKTPPTTELGLK